MPRIEDVLTFREDRFFDGAVQLDWFYDNERQSAAASAFVFHGPQYFGVDSQDIGVTASRLVDTCSFSQMIWERLYGDVEDQNSFLMGIAGYGTGKSHLGLALATLFSGHDKATSKKILANITRADPDIGTSISQGVSKPNLVIALNGMRDFNLNYEILNAARRALALHGQDDSSLRALTKAHEIAAHFLERNFDRLKDSFASAAAERFPSVTPGELSNVLRDSLLSTGDAFEVINHVYFLENGSHIRWDDGISAADVLTRLTQSVCGERGHFNKVLIMFDEFGRFIEYASQYPTMAAESALQQIFEAVQNSNGNIMMVSLIQSDLRTYLARAEKSSNIIRYVGRYETAEKVYLSSNLETIFAHLIDRKDPDTFKHYVIAQQARKDDELKSAHERLKTMLPATSQKSVWQEWNSYRRVILEGTYPLHPITTWMLTTLSEWLQQRSALTFLHNTMGHFGSTKLTEFGDLPYIRPIHLIQSDFFAELLLAEEQGRQQSEFCIQYDGILRKNRDKLSDNDLCVLAANVIARIGRFRTGNRSNVELLLADCAGISVQEVAQSLSFLEDELGILSYDQHSGSFDFVEDAIGAADFKRMMNRKRRAASINPSLIFDGNIRELLGLTTAQQSGFADLRYIKTQEWDYTQDVIWHRDITSERLALLDRDWRVATAPDMPKGKVVWIYVDQDAPGSVHDQLRNRIAQFGLFDAPIVFMLLDDASGHLYDALVEWQVARSLTAEEKNYYDRFVPAHLERTDTAVRDAFEQLQLQRIQITPDGPTVAQAPVRGIVLNTLNSLYDSPIPFMFEGFRAKNLSNARRNMNYIVRNLCSGLVNYQWTNAQTSQIRNRLQAVLYVGSKGSWGILNEQYRLVPPSDPVVRAVYGKLDALLDDHRESEINLAELLDQFTKPPYGANDYSAGLLLATYLSYNQETVKILVDGERVRLGMWAEKSFPDKGIDFSILQKTTIRYADLEESQNRFLAICNAIETNTSLHKWGHLAQQLEKLTKEEDPPEELHDKVEACRMIASQGNKHWTDYDLFVRQQAVFLDDAKDQGDINKALQTVLRAEKRVEDGAALGQYAYGNVELQVLNKMIDLADDIVNDNFEQWLRSRQCRSYAEFSAFEASMNRIARDLRSGGYDHLAMQVRAHLNHIADNMDDVKMRQTLQEATDKFLNICKPSRYTSFEQLTAWDDEGAKLMEYIERSLDRYQARRMMEHVVGRQEEVKQLLQEFRGEISDVLDGGLELETINDCQTLLTRSRSLLSRSIRAEDAEDVREIADALSNLIRDIESLPKAEDSPEKTRQKISTMRMKWTDNDVISADPVLERVLTQYEEDWADLDMAWAKRHLAIEAHEIETWDIGKCSRWQEATKLIPPYISATTHDKFKLIRSAINNRLEELPIEAAIVAYARLSKEQKELFLKRITALQDEIPNRVG